MERKTRITAALISVFLLSAVAGTQLVHLGSANPYTYNCGEVREVAPPAGTLPLTILISSPKNDTAYASNDVSFTFNVSIPGSNNLVRSYNVISCSITEIFYRASWQKLKDTAVNLSSKSHFLQISINMTDVPEGPRWLEVYATAKVSSFETHLRPGAPPTETTIDFVNYKITGSSMVNFTIDTIPPEISIPCMENRTYSVASIPLNFITNEPISQSTYSLDGHENVTIAGNTTLTELSKGNHNLTVYAKDEAGNTSASETIWFSVAEPFPLVPIVAASVASVAVIGLGLLFYFKKRKH